MSRPAISFADLQKGAKALNTADAKPGDKATAFQDTESLNALESLYEKYNGDLDLIFAELKSDPSKAKKPHHKPHSAKEFANNYLQGFYSIISEESAADSKSHK